MRKDDQSGGKLIIDGFLSLFRSFSLSDCQAPVWRWPHLYYCVFAFHFPVSLFSFVSCLPMEEASDCERREASFARSDHRQLSLDDLFPHESERGTKRKRKTHQNGRKRRKICLVSRKSLERSFLFIDQTLCSSSTFFDRLMCYLM